MGGTLTARLRKEAGAAALVLAPLFLVASVLCYAWATRNGGDDYTGAGALELYAAHPELVVASTTFVLLGCLLLVPAMMAALRLLRPGSPRLSLVGASMMVLGYCCYIYIIATTPLVAAMADRGDHLADYAALIDASQEDGGFAASWPFILFVAGNILGTLLLAVAMFRSKAVHWWAAAAVAGWPVSHIIGLSVGSEWFEFGGGLLQVVGFAAMAMAVLRIPAHRWDAA